MATSVEVDDFNRLPKVNTDIETVSFDAIPTQSVLPLVTGVTPTPLTFLIPAIADWYIDVSRIFLKLQVKLYEREVKADGSVNWKAVGNKPSMSPACALLYSLFDELEIEYNFQKVWSTKGNYAIQTFLQLLTKTTKLEREMVLPAALFDLDAAGAHDAVSGTSASVNQAAHRRMQKVDNGAQLEMYGSVRADIFRVDRPLTPNINVTLRYFLAKSEHCVLSPSGTQYRISIDQAELHVARLKPRVPRYTAVYPYVHYETQRYLFAKETKVLGPIPIARSVIPRRVWVMIQTEDRYNGAFTLNRFYFGHNKCNYLALRKNGRLLPYSQGLKMDFVEKKFYQAFISVLHESSGRDESALDLAFDLQDFKAGYAIWCFDTSKSHQYRDESDWDKSEVSGLLELSAHFDDPGNKNLVFLIVSEYERTLSVKRDSTVVINEIPNR